MKPVYHTKPWKHQRQALKFLYKRNFGALYTDMGSGKTKIMIDLIVNRRWGFTLILAPKKVCRVWAPQFKIHAPNEDIYVLDLSKTAGKLKMAKVKEAQALGHKQLVIVLNYDSVWREPFKRFILKAKLDCVICDESHRIKTPGSKCSRMLQTLGRRVQCRYLMTGTPLAQSPLDVYAQYRFLDPTIFGTNYNVFKAEYTNQFIMPGGYPILNKKNPYKNLDDLQEKMFACAFKVDVVDSLPPTTDITIEFDLSPTAQKHYKELRKEGVLELKEGDVVAGNVLAVMTRLQQLSSGYLPVEDLDGNRTFLDVDSSRSDALREWLEDIPPEEQIVIFAKYTRDIKRIRRVVHDIGRRSSELSGKRDTLHNWEAGKTTVLVVQISSGAEGLDLTQARYCVYYTLTQSLVQYKQSRKRVHRPGQTRPVTYVRFIAKMKGGHTIDEQIVTALDNNESLINSIMDDPDYL